MVLLFALLMVNDGALGLLVNLLWYTITYVMFVICMWCLWYIYHVSDVCYAYFLFVWMEQIKTNKKIISGHFAECCARHMHSLPSVLAIALGKGLHWAPGKNGLPSVEARTLGKPDGFAECLGQDTRQTWWLCRVSRLGQYANLMALPSVVSKALGKLGTLPSVLRKTLGKPKIIFWNDFVECLALDTWQTVIFRQVGRNGYFCLPSVKRALGKGFAVIFFCLRFVECGARQTVCRVLFVVWRVSWTLGKACDSSSEAHV